MCGEMKSEYYSGRHVDEWREPGKRWRCEACGVIGKWSEGWGFWGNADGYQCQGVYCSAACAKSLGLNTSRCLDD